MGDGRPAEVVEEERLEALRDLREGRIGVDSTPSREIAMMFVALEQGTKTIFERLAVSCVRPAAGSKATFVLSDHPVAHYDPQPKAPEVGVGFMNSQETETFVALDPRFGVLLHQHTPPQTWTDVEVSDEDVDRLNLLTYAWAREAIFGPTQDSVTRVRRLAKRDQRAMGEFAYRPPRVWLTESQEGDMRHGVRKFTSRFRGNEVTREFYVSPEAVEEAHRHRWPKRDEAA